MIDWFAFDPSLAAEEGETGTELDLFDSKAGHQASPQMPAG